MEKVILETQAERTIRSKVAANQHHKEALKILVDQGWCPPNEWISVKHNPPECVGGHKVLGHNGDYAFECEFDDGFWANIGGEEMTHWMPLVELPSKQII